LIYSVYTLFVYAYKNKIHIVKDNGELMVAYNKGYPQ